MGSPNEQVLLLGRLLLSLQIKLYGWVQSKAPRHVDEEQLVQAHYDAQRDAGKRII